MTSLDFSPVGSILGHIEYWTLPALATDANTVFAAGDVLVADTSTTNWTWKKSPSTGVAPFGIAWKGKAAGTQDFSLLLRGVFIGLSDGVVQPWSYVMPGSATLGRYKAYDGVAPATIIGLCLGLQVQNDRVNTQSRATAAGIPIVIAKLTV